MGRTLELKEISEEEERKILEVIQRDFNLRKKESKRLSKLKKEVGTPPPPKTEEAASNPDKCANCGASLLWLINPKGHCSKCELFFCENKKDCLSEDFYTSRMMCTNCQIETDMKVSSADWFYSQLKGKFRRFGSAKVYRALRKMKKGQSIDSASESEAEPCGVVKGASSSKVLEKFIEEQKARETSAELTTIVESEKEVEKCDITMDHVNHTNSSETNNNTQAITQEDLSQSVKKELEKVISELLLPRLDDLRKQEEEKNKVEKELRVEEATKIAEDIILRALENTKFNNNNSQNEAVAKYLHDNTEVIVTHVSNQMLEETPNSSMYESKPLMCDTSTMTEAESDTESLKSDIVAFEEIRKKQSIQSSSHSSLTSSSSPHSSIKGTVQKQHLIGQAETEAALAEILDADPQPQPEFKSELTYSIERPDSRARSQTTSKSSSRSSSRSSSITKDKTDDNWIIPKTETKEITVIKVLREPVDASNLNTLELSISAYDGHSSMTSDSESDEKLNIPVARKRQVKRCFSASSSNSDSSHNHEEEKPLNKVADPLVNIILKESHKNKLKADSRSNSITAAHIEIVKESSSSSSESDVEKDIKVVPVACTNVVRSRSSSESSWSDVGEQKQKVDDLQKYELVEKFNNDQKSISVLARSRSSSESSKSDKEEITLQAEASLPATLIDTNQDNEKHFEKHGDVVILVPKSRSSSESSHSDEKIADATKKVDELKHEVIVTIDRNRSSSESSQSDAEIDAFVQTRDDFSDLEVKEVTVSVGKSRTSSESSQSDAGIAGTTPKPDQPHLEILEAVSVSVARSRSSSESSKSHKSQKIDDRPLLDFREDVSIAVARNRSSSESSQSDQEIAEDKVVLDTLTPIQVGQNIVTVEARSRSSSESSQSEQDTDGKVAEENIIETAVANIPNISSRSKSKNVVQRSRTSSRSSSSSSDRSESKSPERTSYRELVMIGQNRFVLKEKPQPPLQTASSVSSSDSDHQKTEANPVPVQSFSTDTETKLSRHKSSSSSSSSENDPLGYDTSVVSAQVNITEMNVPEERRRSSSESSKSDHEPKAIISDVQTTTYLEKKVEKVSPSKVALKEEKYRKSSSSSSNSSSDEDKSRISPVEVLDDELVIKEFTVRKIYQTTETLSIDGKRSESISSESTKSGVYEKGKKNSIRARSSSESSLDDGDITRYTDELMNVPTVDASDLNGTPQATFVHAEDVSVVSPRPEESAVAMRLVNQKSIEVLADTVHRIKEVKGEAESSSSSDSSDIEDNIKEDDLNKLEEDIYIATAKTRNMQQQLKKNEKEIEGIDLAKAKASLRMQTYEKQLRERKINLEQINFDGLSIADRMKLLRLAGLQVEQGNMKRSSVKEMKSPTDKPTKRWSVPFSSPPTKPVNTEYNLNQLPRRSFTVHPKSSHVTSTNNSTQDAPSRRSLDPDLLRRMTTPTRGSITVQLPRNSVAVLPPQQQPVPSKRAKDVESEKPKILQNTPSKEHSSSMDSDDKEISKYMTPELKKEVSSDKHAAIIGITHVEIEDKPAPKEPVQKVEAVQPIVRKRKKKHVPKRHQPLPLSEEDAIRIQALVDDYASGSGTWDSSDFESEESDLEKEVKAVRKVAEKRLSMSIEQDNKKNLLVAQKSKIDILTPQLENDDDGNTSYIVKHNLEPTHNGDSVITVDKEETIPQFTVKMRQQELNVASKLLNKEMKSSTGSGASNYSSFDSEREEPKKVESPSSSEPEWSMLI